MRVNIYKLQSFLSNDKTLEDILQVYFKKFYKKQPEIDFCEYVLDDFDKPQDSTNVQRCTLQVPVYAMLWKQKWLQQKAVNTINKDQPDKIISFQQALTINKPQMLIMQHSSVDVKKLNDAIGPVVVPSDYIGDQLRQKGVNPERIKLLRFTASDDFRPVEWKLREEIKYSYTSGNEYILVDASLLTSQQIIQILKSFSLFKKWQKTSTGIFLADMGPQHAEVQNQLPHYKYKDAVTIISGETYRRDKQRILAAAWAMLHFPGQDNTGIPLLEAIQSETPVITHKLGAIEETIGQGAFYCEPGDIESLAEAMILLYKNEKLKIANVQMAKEKLKNFPAKGVEALWQLVLQVGGNS